MRARSPGFRIRCAAAATLTLPDTSTTLSSAVPSAVTLNSVPRTRVVIRSVFTTNGFSASFATTKYACPFSSTRRWPPTKRTGNFSLLPTCRKTFDPSGSATVSFSPCGTQTSILSAVSGRLLTSSSSSSVTSAAILSPSSAFTVTSVSGCAMLKSTGCSVSAVSAPLFSRHIVITVSSAAQAAAAIAMRIIHTLRLPPPLPPFVCRSPSVCASPHCPLPA